MKKTGVYFGGFDELRCLAAVLVVVSHVLPYSTRSALYGQIGVTLFFVLSGFLITYLLLDEASGNNGRVNILFFYFKRVLRIWPLYFFIMFLGFFFYPLCISNEVFPFGSEQWNRALLYYGLFLPHLFHEHIPYVTQLWSIGIEEVFYLIWPWCVVVFGKKIHFASFFVVLLFSSLEIVQHCFPSSGICFILQFGHLSKLAIGGLGASFLFNGFKIMEVFSSKIVQLLTIVILLISLFFNFSLPLLNSIFYSLLFLSVIINVSVVDGSILRLRSTLLASIGGVSYGIYMFQGIVADFVHVIMKGFTFNQPFDFLLELLLVLSIDIAIAYLSFHFVEKKILSLRKFAR